MRPMGLLRAAASVVDGAAPGHRLQAEDDDALAAEPRLSASAPVTCRCVAGMLGRQARLEPEAIALEDRGRRRTFARLVDDIARVARGLHELGVRPGQRVAVVAGLRAETVVAVHAALRIGAIAVIHDPLSTARELRRSFEDHAAVLALVDRSALTAVESLPADLHPKAVVAMDDPRESALSLGSAVRGASPLRLLGALRRTRGSRERSADRVIPWSLLQSAAPLTHEHPCPEPQDLALLQETISADGTQVAAMLTHENLIAAVGAGQALWGEDADDNAPVCATLPLHEASGAATTLVAPLLAGRGLVLAATADEVLAAAGRSALGVLVSAPALLHELCEAGGARAVDGASIRQAVVVQLPLDPQDVACWEAITGASVRVAHVRAESGIALGGPFDPEHPDRLGAPLGEVQVRVGERGALRISGPGIFHGYWNRPDETATVLAGDGWASTGDVVATSAHRPAGGTAPSEAPENAAAPSGEAPPSEALDDRAAGRAEAALELLSRRPSAIITREGRTVSPREVAGALRGHPAVEDVQVGASPLPHGGERIEAEVRLRSGAHATVDELLAFAAERLSPAKLPARVRVLRACHE